ncbi:MAG TPA: hypothetical protein VN088_06610, partial [Nocardioides sp.]|nr:hypothetical protein [Nocardioides sp.]
PDAGPLATVLEHTMVKDPAQRWPMSRVRDELAAIARGEVPQPQETQVLPVVPSDPTVPLVEPAQATSAAPVPQRWRRPLLAVLAVLAVVLVVGILVSLLDGGDGGTPAAQDHTSGSSTTEGPTVAGMRDFIRTYVTTVADDPATAWRMLTPTFQRESGGFTTYQRFWEPAENGTVTDIQADATTLHVSYRPHFDHWHNNRYPTRLVLVYQDGQYLIDAEHTIGFTPVTTTSSTTTAPPPAPKPHAHHKGKGHKKK